MTVKAYGAHAADKPLESMDITRRAPGAHDVQIDIAFCGVCHSDLHQVRARVGRHALPLRAGPRNRRPRRPPSAPTSPTTRSATWSASAAWSTAARHCADCGDGLENYCDGMVGTYNGPDRDAPGHTLGGYSEQIVVHERFVLRVNHPEEQLAAVAPLLCAGITTYSPLRHWNAGPGQEGRHRRHRRPGPHGHQAGARDGRPRGRVHHLRTKRAGCRSAGRRRSRGLARRRRHGRASEDAWT